MPSSRSLVALAAAASTASAAYQGFNYGSTFTDGSAKGQSDFEAEFNAASDLAGTNGDFTSARLYTMIQGGSANGVISAIPAAIKTKTSLLLGLWASGNGFDNEIAALQATIDQYCGDLDSLVAGISVGSEDLYRNSPIGMENDENPGADPDTLVGYIDRVRDTIKGSCLKDAPIGHVDTWTAYVNGSNNAVIEACDWLGMDAYPYFENTKPNSIDNGKDLFQSALGKVKGVSGGKEVWITETGWPVSGKVSGDATASKDNARTFWEEVGCPMFGNTNVWWYTLLDAAPATPNPSFGVIGQLGGEPLYDLSCDDRNNGSKETTTSSSSSSSAQEVTSKTEASTQQPETSSTSEADAETTTVSSTMSSATGSSSDGGAEVVTTTTMTQAVSSTSAAADTSSSSSSADSGSDSGSGSGSGDNTDATTVAPTTSDSGSGSDSAPTTVPEGSAARLNSYGAAAVGLVLAAAVL